jgi:hypothetical protein
MLKDLETFLLGILPIPRVELYVSALKELEHMQFNYGAGEVYQLWSGSAMVDTAQQVDETESILRKAMSGMIHRYGISLNTYELSKMTAIAKRLRHLDESIEHELIMGVLCKEDDPIAMLTELLAIPFGESWSKFIDDIAYVNDEYFERVELYHDVENDEYNEPPDTTLLRRYTNLNKNTFAERLVREHGQLLGTEIHVSADYFKADLKKLCPDHPANVAIELLGLAILTGACYDDIVTIASRFAETFYTEPDFIMKLRPEMNKVLSGVPRYG